jgi:hypothetical protein
METERLQTALAAPGFVSHGRNPVPGVGRKTLLVFIALLAIASCGVVVA